MNEDEATRLFSRAADSIPPIPRPPASQLIQRGKRVQRRQRLISAGSVAAVAALIIGAGALWLPGTNGSAQPTPADETTASDDGDRNPLPTPPEGTRWVGFNGVMVAVPESWTVNDTMCGQPRSHTVAFNDQGHDDCAIDGAFTVVRVMALSSPLGQQWEDVSGQAVNVDGVTAVRVGGDVCRLSRPPQCSGLLAIPDRDAVFVVESRRSAEEVDAILDTARLVPEGYTAVPDVAASTNDEDAARVMSSAGLEWTPRCPVNAACDLPALEATNPRAGTVVPVGTTVTAVHPAEDDGTVNEPPADEAPQCAAVSKAGVFDLWEAPPPGRTLDEAVQDFMDNMSAAHSYDIAAQNNDDAYVAVLDESQALVATVLLKQWNSGSWTATDWTECSTEAEGPPPTDELPGEPPTQSEMVGAWRLVSGADTDSQRTDQRIVTFTYSVLEEGLVWTGSDGCNGMGGSVEYRADGTFRGQLGDTTLIGCDSTGSGGPVIVEATQVRLDDDRLTFYNDVNELLGTFVRSDATDEEAPITDALNAETVRRGTELLRNGGVHSIHEAEHGFREASLSGTWNDLLVTAGVAPEGVRLAKGHITNVEELGGEQVLTVDVPSLPYPLMRFTYGSLTVDLQVFTKDGKQFLRRDSRSLVSTILCPSDCGDVPDGADG